MSIRYPTLIGDPRAIETWVAHTRRERAKAWVDGHVHGTCESSPTISLLAASERTIYIRLDEAGYQANAVRRCNKSHVYAVRRHVLKPRDLQGGRVMFQTLLAITSQLDATYGWESTIVEPEHTDVQ